MSGRIRDQSTQAQALLGRRTFARRPQRSLRHDQQRYSDASRPQDLKPSLLVARHVEMISMPLHGMDDDEVVWVFAFEKKFIHGGAPNRDCLTPFSCYPGTCGESLPTPSPPGPVASVRVSGASFLRDHGSRTHYAEGLV